MIGCKTARVSDRGGRETNEDYADCAIVGELGCWVVADGLGAHRGGEVASRLAVEKILEAFRARPELSAAALTSYLEAAHQGLHQQQIAEPALRDMRTTVVALLSNGRSALWAHVGDSRLYQIRGGTVAFQTRDHSVPQVLAEAGEITPNEVRHHEDGSRLLRSLGVPGSLRADVEKTQPLRPGDAFLLCVDGFWQLVAEPEMEIDFAKAQGPDDWLHQMETRVRETASPGHDNYTAIAVLFDDAKATIGSSAGSRGPFHRRSLSAVPREIIAPLAGVMLATLLIGDIVSRACQPRGVGENPQGGRELIATKATGSARQTTLVSSGVQPTAAPAPSCPEDMVLIPKGAFTMGSPEEDHMASLDEKPPHQVFVPQFCLDIHEVTNANYDQLASTHAGRHGQHSPCGECSVVGVTWDEARKTCEMLGKRLPTEAEWERAARGNLQASRYPWGDAEPTEARANFCAGGAENGADCRGEEVKLAISKSAKSSTQPVGRRAANGFDLADMAGNVWEWCQDWYGKDYYKRSPSTAPPGAESGPGRVVRGGAWDSDAPLLRCANRWFVQPSRRMDNVGFRCATTPTEGSRAGAVP